MRCSPTRNSLTVQTRQDSNGAGRLHFFAPVTRECYLLSGGAGQAGTSGRGSRIMIFSKRAAFRGLALAAVAVVASGCTGTRYMPPSGQLAPVVAAPQELRGFEGAASIDFDVPGGYASPNVRTYPSELATAEVSGWFEAPGDEITVSLSHDNMDDRGWGTMAIYFLSLGLLPSWVTSEGETVLEVKAGDEVLFQNRETVAYRTSLSVWLPTAYAFGSPGKGQYQVMTSDQLNRHKLALGQYIASQKADYERAVSAGTVSAYRQYLKDNPDSFFRMETMRRLSGLAPVTNSLAFHRENVMLDNAYLVYLPDEYDIWFIGPEGMRVYDVLRLSRTEDDALLASRIRAARQPYKVFDSDEISMLKEGGISSTLIAAMIDASANAGSAPAPAPVAATPAMQPALAAPAPGEAAPAAQNTVGDIAAQCAKRYAAMKACDQVPSFGANICRSQVKKKYSHIACELIQ